MLMPNIDQPCRSGKQKTLEQDQNILPKVKALNSTILRLTESNQRLQSENKLLKTDLERALQAGDSTDEDRNSRKSIRNRGKALSDRFHLSELFVH